MNKWIKQSTHENEISIVILSIEVEWKVAERGREIWLLFWNYFVFVLIQNSELVRT